MINNPNQLSYFQPLVRSVLLNFGYLHVLAYKSLKALCLEMKIQTILHSISQAINEIKMTSI